MNQAKVKHKLEAPNPVNVWESVNRYADESIHKAFVRVLAEVYNQELNATTEVKLDSGHGIVDIVVDFNSDAASAALEVKTGRVDLKRSLWQCRQYVLEGYAPYVVVDTKRTDISIEYLEDTFLDFRDNTPGLVRIGAQYTTVMKLPNYEINY